MDTLNDFPVSLSNVADYVMANIHRIDESANGVNYSANDYGFSAYIYLNNGVVPFPAIIRVSDHSLDGSRERSTICLDSIEAVERWITQVEKVKHPERFNITEHGYQWYKGEKIMVKSYERK